MPTALVTGASAGIGEVFAYRLAKRKFDLVLVARRGDRLEKIAQKVTDTDQVHCEIVVMDLGEPDAPARLFAQLADKGIPVDLLVNNAGFGIGGKFGDQDPARLEQMLALNITSLTLLTRLALERMLPRRSGTILNVASLAAFQAVPNMAAYAASKAYVLHLTEALAEELKGTGVAACCLCPGSTATEFADVAKVSMAGADRVTQTPEQVVDEALAGLDQGRRLVVPGWHNQVAAAAGRLVPRRLATVAAGLSMQNR